MVKILKSSLNVNFQAAYVCVLINLINIVPVGLTDAYHFKHYLNMLKVTQLC